MGVDTMKLAGAEVANVMKGLSAGFEEGYLQAPTITCWPFGRAIQAYEAVEKGGTPTKHVLIPDTAPQ